MFQGNLSYFDCKLRYFEPASSLASLVNSSYETWSLPLPLPPLSLGLLDLACCLCRAVYLGPTVDARAWLREYLIQRVLDTGYGLRFSTTTYGSKREKQRFSTNMYRKLVLFLQRSPNISGNIREFNGRP